MTTIEAAVKLLEENPNPVSLQRHFPEFVEGMTDLVKVIQDMQLNDIAQRTKLDKLEAELTDLKTVVGTLAKDRDTLASRQDAVEKTPSKQAADITELQKRVRTIEGAVTGLSK